MKILEVITVPFFEPRGTAFSSLYRTRALASLGHDIDIATYPLGKDVTIPRTTIMRSLRIPGIKTIPMGASIKKLLLEICLAIKVFFMLLRNSYDVIHAHEESVFYSIFYKKIFNIKLLYDMHSSMPEQFSNYKTYNIGLFKWIARIFERYALHCSDHIIVICSRLKEYVLNINPKASVSLIENINLDEIHGDVPSHEKDTIIESRGLKDKKIILYTGTLGYNQGVDILVESMAMVASRIPHVCCVIIGGEPKEVERIRSQAHSLSIERHIQCEGTLPYQSIQLYLSIADILVSPRREGLNIPLKVYSYMLSGKPIVATDLKVHTQLLNPDIALLVKPTPHDLAEGIGILLMDKKLSCKIGSQARQYAYKHFSEKSYIEKVKSAYSHLLNPLSE